MDFSPTLPNIKKNSSKDIMIRILSANWPLSIKKIKTHLKRDYGISVSYQGIYQSLNELIEKNIVEKKNNEFLLNIDWIRGIQEFGKSVEQSYKGQRKIIGSGIKSAQMTFNSGYDLFKFILDMITDHINSFSDEEKKKGGLDLAYVQQTHLWSPFVATKGDYKQIKELGKYGSVYYLCKNNTLMDKMLTKFYESFNAKVKLNSDVASDADIYVIGDWTIQVFLPIEIKKQINNAYSSTKDILSFDIIKFYWNLGHMNQEFEVLVNKTPSLAKIIKEQVRANFE